jgi:hypothetical protein
MTLNEAITVLKQAREKIGGDALLLTADNLHVVDLPVSDDSVCVFACDVPQPGTELFAWVYDGRKCTQRTVAAITEKTKGDARKLFRWPDRWFLLEGTNPTTRKDQDLLALPRKQRNCSTLGPAEALRLAQLLFAKIPAPLPPRQMACTEEPARQAVRDYLDLFGSLEILSYRGLLGYRGRHGGED